MTFGSYAVNFAPYLPNWALIGLVGMMLFFAALSAWPRPLSLLLRAIAVGLFSLLLLNPQLLRQDTQEKPTKIVILQDDSESMSLFARKAQALVVKDRILSEVAAIKADIEVEFQSLGLAPTLQLSPGQTPQWGGNQKETSPKEALRNALQRHRSDQLGGVFIVTDGGLFDIDESFSPEQAGIPIHTLLVGGEAKFDIRPEVIAIPQFAVVGDRIPLTIALAADGAPPKGLQTQVQVRFEDDVLFDGPMGVGEEIELDVEAITAGDFTLEIRAGKTEGELTELNNTVTQPLSIVRQRLRVLLVSGSPYAGQRTWRDLLKSDAGVELVHFTILRTPFKQDATIVEELALIPFPTQELFIDQIDTFDLIIFDRYKQSGILPLHYFASIRDRILNGGGLLVISGPGFATNASIADTFLSDILPATPTGEVIDEPYRPTITDVGRRHPIVASLDPELLKDKDNGPHTPNWGRWTRIIGTQAAPEDVLMQGHNDLPLLSATRSGEGRVAQISSDQVWLWARGFDGGGPYQSFVRRIIHWLLKQPDLEEESLSLQVLGSQLKISRQTLSEKPKEVQLRAPDGALKIIELAPQNAGNWSGTIQLEHDGRYTAFDAALSKSIWYGKGSSEEFKHLLTTDRMLKPLSRQTGGGVQPVGASESLNIRLLPPQMQAFTGTGWSGIRKSDASLVIGEDRSSLFKGLLAALLLIAVLTSIWIWERRV